MSTRVLRANHVVQPGDDLLLCDAGAGSFTITLPPLAPPSYLRRIQVRKCDRNIVTTVTINLANGTTIRTLAQPNAVARLGCTGLDWTDEVHLQNLPPKWPWGA